MSSIRIHIKSLFPLLMICVMCVMTLLFTGCYNRTDWKLMLSDSTLTDTQRDSITFIGKHHYGINYNFIIKSDSLQLIQQEPEEYLEGLTLDTFSLYKNSPIVVADFKTLPTDSIDSLWVKVADDNFAIGWLHESDLHKGTIPDDPISQFIDLFSNTHLLVFFVIIIVIISIYVIRHLMRNNARLVHFNDIDSFYPTFLALLVALSATVYASIQKFYPDLWQEYYYHPTLNPFICPMILSLFLIMVWLLVVVAIAVIDDVRRQLPIGEAVLYICGLLAMCALNYIVFSILTLYYIGYLLLAVYIIFALWRYFTKFRSYYQCGHCGADLRHKGVCPHCGSVNK